MDSSPALVEFRKVDKNFGDTQAINNVSFRVQAGEFVFITGPSGAGKTTLLRLLLAEIRPSSGEIFFDDLEVHSIKKGQIPALRRKIGAIFQDYKLIENKTLNENLEVVLAIHQIDKASWSEKIEDVLNKVGLLDRLDLFPAQLSGGETQRAAIARALVVEPKLIFADEPTGNLDWETGEGIIKLLTEINKEGKTVIVTTHNIDLIKKSGRRVIKIKAGKIEK